MAELIRSSEDPAGTVAREVAALLQRSDGMRVLDVKPHGVLVDLDGRKVMVGVAVCE